MTAATESNNERLRALFAAYHRRVFVYASRHVGVDEAQDVVADVFLTAWQKLDGLPSDPLPWLLRTARNLTLHRARSRRRHERLVDLAREVERLRGVHPSAESIATERQVLLAALWELTEREREALLLTAWDGLSLVDAAHVARCSLRAFTVRLSRARARLDRELATDLNEEVTEECEVAP
jgi:RNA polymerase sigma-70 factor (ECF subfamily)